jgi:hypothetical protein
VVAPEVGTSTRPRSSRLTDGRTHSLAPCETPGQGTERINGPYRVSVADLDGADLVTLEHGARRAVAAAATEALMTQLSAAALSARTDTV